MNTLLLLQQMLILFAMMLTGFAACKAGWADRQTGQKVTSLIVHILNPALIISSLCGKKAEDSGSILVQNIGVVLLYFLFLILCGFLYCRIRSFSGSESGRIQLLTVFSNVGFMGIPVVRNLYGAQYLIFVVFYMLVFNILIYTYGVFLCFKMKGDKAVFSPGRILNTGTIVCAAAILLFVLQIPMPASVLTFFSGLGDAAIPLSMIVIGISVAQTDLKELLRSKENYIFLLFKMLLVPAAGILLFGLLPLNPYVYRIFALIVGMPCATLTGMMAQEYAGRGDECNRMILLSTICSVVTIPLVSLLVKS